MSEEHKGIFTYSNLKELNQGVFFGQMGLQNYKGYKVLIYIFDDSPRGVIFVGIEGGGASRFDQYEFHDDKFIELIMHRLNLVEEDAKHFKDFLNIFIRRYKKNETCSFIYDHNANKVYEFDEELFETKV